MIPLTSDFIRGLSGISEAELPDSLIDSMHVIAIAEEAALAYPTLSDTESLYYKGYKAIVLLGPGLLSIVAQTIKDNFNQFTRFDNDALKDLLDLANGKVIEVENPTVADLYTVFDVVAPEVDPVTQEAR